MPLFRAHSFRPLAFRPLADQRGASRAGLLLLVVAGMALLAAIPAGARAILDPADPAFAGSVSIPFPPPGLPVGAFTSFQFHSNDATILLECPELDPCPVVSDAILSGGNGGLRVTIHAPVTAIGFGGAGLDGLPGGLFTGSQGSERIDTTTTPVFFGAADIGDIGSVDLSRPANFFRLTEMRFVPPPPVPPGPIPPPGVYAEALAGKDDLAEVDSDGSPGTADASDDNGERPITGSARGRAELSNSGFVRRRLHAISSVCGGDILPNTGEATARLTERYVATLSQGAPTPSGVDIDVGIDFDGLLLALRLATITACQGENPECPVPRSVGPGQIQASVAAQVRAYTDPGLPSVEIFSETATLDYAQARDGTFAPSAGWNASWHAPTALPAPFLYFGSVAHGAELEFFDVVDGVLTVPVGDTFTIEFALTTQVSNSFKDVDGEPGCAYADFFHTGSIEVTTPTPGVVLVPVDAAGNPLPAPEANDLDGDGIDDALDVCPDDPDADQADADGDTVGDACDVCRDTPDPAQGDGDADDVGDACDACPTAPDTGQLDVDGDAVGNACDNSPLIPNPDQADADADDVGDVSDNCLITANFDQTDQDRDGVGDACDNCPGSGNPEQADADGDASGDVCDLCPSDPSRTAPSAEICDNGIDEDCDGADAPCAPGGDEVCGDCTDEDGDGLPDVDDPDCASIFAVPLALTRGVLRLIGDGDGGAMSLDARLGSAPDGVDPPSQGVTISLADESGAIACLALPPGEGWKRRKDHTGWFFRDRGAHLSTGASLQGRVDVRTTRRNGELVVEVDLREPELLRAPRAGEIRTGISIGARGAASRQVWRPGMAGQRLVTP